MMPIKTKIVNPTPYYNIIFECSNRAFYTVKSELYAICNDIGIDAQDGYMEETCDYEGDLDTIRIYREGRNEIFASAVLKYYGVDAPEGMDIVLSIY